MHIGALFFIGSVISRKKHLVKAGGFKPDYSPLTCDSALWLRTLLITDVACIGRPLVKYRNYLGNTCSKYHGINFLIEHYNVVGKILIEHHDKIQNDLSLKKELEINFFQEAIRRGVEACAQDDFELASTYIKWARTISDGLMKEGNYWKLRLRLILGPKADRILCLIRKTMNRLWQ
jgi:hypothetical protein